MNHKIYVMLKKFVEDADANEVDLFDWVLRNEFEQNFEELRAYIFGTGKGKS